MNRIAFYAHFDGENQIKPYVLDSLERLRGTCSRILFISNSPLAAAELKRVGPYVDETLLRSNSGYDFAMWRHGLETWDVSACDELVFTNSSIVGPIYPLAPIFESMGKSPCDFWGMTDSHEICWHLQTYFLVFKSQVISSEAFRAFWASVLPVHDKHQAIRSYELGLTSFLMEQGFSAAAFAAMDSWATPRLKSRMERKRRLNPTLYYPLDLLKAGMPFVKVELLRDNPAGILLDPIYERMGKAGYDMSRIEFNRPVKTGRALRLGQLLRRLAHERSRDR